MKKNIYFLIYIVISAIFLAVSYLFIPQSVRDINSKIKDSNPLILNEKRFDLIRGYGDFLLKGLPHNIPKLYFYWFGNQRKLADIRIENAIAEIKKTKIENDSVRVWSLLNMGTVIKTKNHTIAIDTANLPFSKAHDKLIGLVDVFLVTHDDGDHYDYSLLKKASEKNKVILPDGFIIKNDKPENIITPSSRKTIEIDGVRITSYQTDHRGDGNFAGGGNWYIIETDGFKILHTGDGRDFKNKNESEIVYSMGDIDILLGNIMIHSYNIRDLSPKVLIPLHLYKFMSGAKDVEQSFIEEVSAKYNVYKQDLAGIKIIYLLPGESYSYPEH